MNRIVCHRFIAAALLAAASQVFAADLSPGASDALATARARISEQKWTAAIDELKRVNQPESADWNNLMGYSMRKQAAPDYAAAGKYYDEALRIDPKHRGALEYSGELALITGDLPRAEARLAALDKACRFSCEEYRDLKGSIERYKSAGNKYVAKQ